MKPQEILSSPIAHCCCVYMYSMLAYRSSALTGDVRCSDTGCLLRSARKTVTKILLGFSSLCLCANVSVVMVDIQAKNALDLPDPEKPS